MYQNIYKNLTKGFTLVEVLIGMLISLLLTSLLLEMYLASQRCFQLQTSLRRIETNAKMAIALLSSEIRKAGTIGCAHLSQDFHIPARGLFELTSQNKLRGSENQISIRYADFPAVVLNETMHNRLDLSATLSVRFAKKDLLIIADCKKAELIEVEHISVTNHAQHIVTSQPLHDLYEKNAELGRLVINKYFVAKTDRFNQDGSPIYALFVENLKHRKTEVLEGVNQLSFHYSMIQNGKIIETSHVEEGEHVIGIAISLQLRYFPIQKTWFTYVSLR